MFYVDVAYVAGYLGKLEADLPADIVNVIDEAESLVDYYTMLRARKVFVDTETDDLVKTDLKNAVAAQVGWMLEMQELEMDKFQDVSSFSIGSFSMNFNTQGGVRLIGLRTNRLLKNLGLVYRGVSS